MQFNKILVPIDFSEFSDSAVDYALFWGELFGAEVTLLHALVLHQFETGEEEHLRAYEKFARVKEEHMRLELQRYNQQVSRRRPVTVTSRLIRAVTAADGILEEIYNNGYDMVVLGTHGRTGLKKWLYGSVAEKVVRLSPIPVLTVHHPVKRFRVDRILVPVDFSEYSRKAVQAAEELRRVFQAQLHFLHVIYPEFHPAYYVAGIESLFALDKDLKTRSLEKLREFTGNINDGAVYTVLEGKPHEEIVNYAREQDVDLILMATRGLSGLEHLLIGSTTERVVRLAKMPVLTIERERQKEASTEA